MGMIKYIAEYIPYESELPAPLWSLLNKENAWQWQAEHEQSLVNIKRILATEPVLRYYDVTKAVTI